MPQNSAERLAWGNDNISLSLDIGPDRPVAITSIGGEARAFAGPGLSLVEILTTDTGKRTGGRLIDTIRGAGLRYVSHEEGTYGGHRTLSVVTSDADLRATTTFTLRGDSAVVRIATRVDNAGGNPVSLLAVSSASFEFASNEPGAIDLYSAQNEWLAENRWTRASLRERGLPDLGAVPGMAPRGRYAVTSEGTWSTGSHLPLGAMVREDGACLIWQVEHNGGWRWEVGETETGAYVAAFGPTDPDHQWSVTLQPGESFDTVPAALGFSPGGFTGAIGELTRYRRADRRISSADAGLPVIFNDYMNTLVGDPSTEKLLPLIAAAGSIGAEIFCVDAGWYSDAPGWWDSVGEWAESPVRFPNGFTEVFDAIRSAGMVPGLWLEPEVVGVRSPVLAELAHDAIFTRSGNWIAEDGRYHLDFRHPGVVERMNLIVDGLVTAYGLGYLKFDYNTNPGPGTDVDGASPGAGLLGANRAWLRWLDDLTARHPQMIIENCASGGLRADWATMSRLDVLSTSDQTVTDRYVPIAANSAATVLPEQAGIWSYPQPGMATPEAITTLANSMLGRPFLAGRLDGMTEDELALVRDAVRAYKDHRASIPEALPVWPWGPAKWDDSWITTALAAPGRTLLTIWRRSSTAGSPEFADVPVEAVSQVSQVFPPPLSNVDRGSYELSDPTTVRVWLPEGSALCLSLQHATDPASAQ